MCLTRRTTGRTPGKETLQVPKWVELQRKTGQRGLLIASRKRLGKKDSDRAITPVVEAVCVPAQLSLPGPVQAKQLRHLQAQLSLGQSCHRQKKKPCTYACRIISAVFDSLQPCRLWLARLLHQVGVSSSKNNGTYGPILVAIPFYISCCPSCQHP